MLRTSARTPRRARLLALIALLFIAVFAPASPPNSSDLVVVFGAEACRMVAYDKHATTPRPYAEQTVIPRASNGGRDSNAQVCFFPDGSGWFIEGEDTGQPAIPAGWGIFQLQGQPGSFTANQVGKLTPTYQPQDFFQPENYGCGFLSEELDGLLVTTDVGDQYPPLPGNGQLILWFPPFDRWSNGPPFDGSTGQVEYCKLDVEIETAGGIYVDEDDNIYVASNRPTVDAGGEVDLTAAGPGGVIVYHPPFPTGNDAASGCGLTDATGAPLATTVDKELIIPANYALGVLTASAIARAPNGNLYVSSVFSGKIAEFELDSLNASLGIAERFIMQPPLGEGPPAPGPSVPLFPTNGTPFGIGVDPDDGQVYYADLGIGTTPPGPVSGEGDVYRVPFDLLGNPLAPVKISDEPYDYPDGIGVLERAMLIHPSPTLVRTGKTKQFTVVGLGLSNSVIWSVEEAAGGTITVGGLYTAPVVVPPGGRAHVLATSVDDSSVVGRAPVDIRQNAGKR